MERLGEAARAADSRGLSRSMPPRLREDNIIYLFLLISNYLRSCFILSYLSLYRYLCVTDNVCVSSVSWPSVQCVVYIYFSEHTHEPVSERSESISVIYKYK